jgi:hypothetical protein
MNDHLYPDDWRVIEPRFRDEYGNRTLQRRPWTRGVNFMTPEILGFVDVDGEAVEVSTGTGFHGERIYGLTWEDANDDRSRLCHTWDEVRDVLG